MIACRSLLRVDSTFIFTNSYLRLKSFQQLQVCYLHSSLNLKSMADRTRSKQGLMEQKSKKKTPHVWRPISTQSTITQGKTCQSGDRASGSSTFQSNNEEGTSYRPKRSENKHSVSLEVGAPLMRFIKGSWGSTQKKIEEEIGVKLIFPPSRNEDAIVIEGNSAASITKASERIQSIVDEAVKTHNLDYSHFVSLPLALHPKLVEKLVNFQTSILETNNLMENEKTESKHSSLLDTGIEKSMFIKPATFHLTVLMLKLWNKQRVAAADKVLQSVASKVHEALDSRPVSIRLKGLQCMRGTPEKALVVYAPVEEIGCEGRLERACQVIIDAFVEAGLVLEKDAQNKLKLHATLMNARFRKRKEKTRFTDSFDARGIFEQYGSLEWGEYLVPEAHLSQRFVFDEKGYYHCCTSIPFPKACN